MKSNIMARIEYLIVGVMKSESISKPDSLEMHDKAPFDKNLLITAWMKVLHLGSMIMQIITRLPSRAKRKTFPTNSLFLFYESNMKD
jgi:hypothetical protein